MGSSLTAHVSAADNMAERWAAFGWRVSTVDGHAAAELASALAPVPQNTRPHIVLAKTVFGRGVEFMEQGVPLTQRHLPVQAINWHYLPMSDEEFDIALRGLGGN
jgi:transketolase